MSRLSQTFARTRDARRAALVTYLVAGDPTPASTPALMQSLVNGGADVIELGIPFTDPVADGPVIQAGCERALAADTRLADVFDILRRFRATDDTTPVVLMGYLNPLEAMGYEAFCAAAAEAGADGVLIVDLPVEEAGELHAVLAAHSLDAVMLVAPTTSPARLARVCQSASGFVYYVSLKGVTGAGGLDVADVASHLARIREQTDLPVGAGFGISDADMAAKLGRVSDAVIIGSAIVRQIATGGEQAGETLRSWTAGIRAALES